MLTVKVPCSVLTLLISHLILSEVPLTSELSEFSGIVLVSVALLYTVPEPIVASINESLVTVGVTVPPAKVSTAVSVGTAVPTPTLKK